MIIDPNFFAQLVGPVVIVPCPGPPRSNRIAATGLKVFGKQTAGVRPKALTGSSRESTVSGRILCIKQVLVNVIW